MAAKVKAAREKEEKGQKNEKPQETEEWFLGKHPLTGLEGAGVMLLLLRKQFHSMLQTVANLMPQVSGFQPSAKEGMCTGVVARNVRCRVVVLKIVPGRDLC